MYKINVFFWFFHTQKTPIHFKPRMQSLRTKSKYTCTHIFIYMHFNTGIIKRHTSVFLNTHEFETLGSCNVTFLDLFRVLEFFFFICIPLFSDVFIMNFRGRNGRRMQKYRSLFTQTIANFSVVHTRSSCLTPTI